MPDVLADDRRSVTVRFVTEYCRPDPAAVQRARALALDPTRSPRLSAASIGFHGATPVDAMAAIVRRLDVPVRQLRAGAHRRYPGAPWLWGQSYRQDLDGDALVPLAEISEGLTLPEVLAALQAVAGLPPPARGQNEHLPFVTIAEVREAYGEHVMEPRAAKRGDS